MPTSRVVSRLWFPVMCLILAGGALGTRAAPAAAPKAKSAPPAAAAKAAAASPVPAAPTGPQLEPSAVKALGARSIGPAVMGGRVADIALDPQDPYTFYIALGTGGVLKTSDNGGAFAAIFEHEKVASIGAVAVAPSDPKIVWVGTGEANDRNSSSWGDGVYRSAVAGGTWTNVGLSTSRTIARIAVHPTDPNTAYVAAMGDLWRWGGDRGLYKTSDGGQTWKRVLAAAAPYEARMGCGDVLIDPAHPDTLYAALYARQRSPWSFIYGAEATEGQDLGGIFKSTDAGATWTKLKQGLPGQTGRIGLALSAKNPQIVMAVVQSDEGGQGQLYDGRSRAGGVFRSDDGGATWKRVNPLDPRPFYFSQIRIDPENDQRVYVLGFMLHVSDDGGVTFREDLFGKVHADCHALAIDPRRPSRLLLGTDGGVYQSYKGGEGWQHLSRFAGGEFYRINVDLSVPYRICGGLQDNTNWVGPSRVFSKDGILNSDWIQIGGGDGFYCVFDPQDPHVVYAESQEGVLHRFNLQNGEIKELRPSPAEGHPEFRFHWNSPLIGSRHAPGTLYLAGNRIFRLTERGEKWALISPDLTTRDPDKTTAVGSGAENYGVVYTLAESPLKAGLLWAGTDDGKLWVTQNDGAAWTDLTASLPAAVKGQWLSRIEASGHDADTAFLAVAAYRTGVYAPLAFMTVDRGKTWRSIAGNLPDLGPVKVVRQDPVNPLVLYAGTEFGLLTSLDAGAHWTALGGLPTVAVDDIVVHPREHDLVIATHGRSLYVIDDLTPLTALTREVAAKPAHLFAPRPAFGRYPWPGWVDSAGSSGIYRGDNPPDGASISFWVQQYTGDPVKIEITNDQKRPVARLNAPGTPGIGRVTWDLKPTKDLLTDYGGEGADKFVRPGDYTVTLTYGKISQSQPLKVEIAAGIETRTSGTAAQR